MIYWTKLHFFTGASLCESLMVILSMTKPLRWTQSKVNFACFLGLPSARNLPSTFNAVETTFRNPSEKWTTKST